MRERASEAISPAACCTSIPSRRWRFGGVVGGIKSTTGQDINSKDKYLQSWSLTMERDLGRNRTRAGVCGVEGNAPAAAVRRELAVSGACSAAAFAVPEDQPLCREFELDLQSGDGNAAATVREEALRTDPVCLRQVDGREFKYGGDDCGGAPERVRGGTFWTGRDCLRWIRVCHGGS